MHLLRSKTMATCFSFSAWRLPLVAISCLTFRADLSEPVVELTEDAGLAVGDEQSVGVRPAAVHFTADDLQGYIGGDVNPEIGADERSFFDETAAIANRDHPVTRLRADRRDVHARAAAVAGRRPEGPGEGPDGFSERG